MIEDCYGLGYVPHLKKEQVMTVTDNHTVKFNTDQIRALGKLVNWYLGNADNITTFDRDEDGNLEAVSNVLDYSLTNPDLEF